MVDEYNLSKASAAKAVEAYRNMLKGDEVYHAPVAEAADGIIKGGYV